MHAHKLTMYKTSKDNKIDTASIEVSSGKKRQAARELKVVEEYDTKPY